MKILHCHCKETLFIIFSLIILLMTNVYPDYYLGVTTFVQGDTFSYREIALFAPSLPDHVIHYHHAQRFFLPYCLGVISKLSGLPLEPLFRVVNLALFFAIAFIFYRTLKNLNLPNGWLFVICILVLFNPYVTRYSLSFHFMANSLLFVLGFLLVCRGFILNQKSNVFLGLAIAALGRQTALLLLPTVWFWFYLVWYRQDNKFSFVIKLILGSLSVPLIYVIGGIFAAGLGGKNINITTMTGIFASFRDINPHEVIVLIEFMIRGLMAHAWIVSLFFAWYLLNDKPKLGSIFWLLVLLSISVCIQPVLGGPTTTGNNLVRLVSISHLGFALAFAIALQSKQSDLSWRFLFAVFVLCLIGSMHHRWSLIGEILHTT
ncbi:MAG: hypothetical protein V1701_00755, partial [Planctomycetota bacterium]